MNPVLNKGVLCTIDFSASSNEALRWAVALARETHNRLTVLYTYRLFAKNGEAIKLKRDLESEALRKFSALEKECLSGKGIEYDFRTEVGFMTDRVRDHVEKNGVSFLVMGKKMNVTNKESVDELVESIHIPLVIVP